MQYTSLGNTDIKVSKICLGTMTFGEQNNEAEAHEQLDYALNQGINFIDTAELYAVPTKPETQGKTEELIGTWIKARNNRDQYILATKIVGPSPNLLYIRDPLNFSPTSIHTAVEGSLKRLQTDYIDLYQLHWPMRKTNFFSTLGYRHREDDPWEEDFLTILETLDGLVKEGKIRHIGISNETPWGMSRFLNLSEKHDLPRVVSIQNPYNLLNRAFEVGLAEMAIREQVGLLAYSPMAFGLLSGKFHNGTARPDARLNKYKNRLPRYLGEQSQKATAEYLKIAEDFGASLAQMSLAFVTAQPFLTSNFIGATSMRQLKENIDSINLEMTRDMVKAINEVHKVYSNPAP